MTLKKKIYKNIGIIKQKKSIKIENNPDNLKKKNDF